MFFASCGGSTSLVTFSWKSAPSSLASARRSGNRSSSRRDGDVVVGGGIRHQKGLRICHEATPAAKGVYRWWWPATPPLPWPQSNTPTRWVLTGERIGRGFLHKCNCHHKLSCLFFFLVFTTDFGKHWVQSALRLNDFEESGFVLYSTPICCHVITWIPSGFWHVAPSLGCWRLFLLCAFHHSEFYLHHRWERCCPGSRQLSGTRGSPQTEVLSEPPPQTWHYQATWFVEN